MDELDTLARRAGERAREHARDRRARYGVDDVAARSARGRRTSRLAGAGATVVVALVAVLLIADLRGPGSVTIEPVAPGGSAVVEVPPVGSASAVHLEDGTPVFVSHPTDDDVVVLDATNSHVGDKLVAFCESSGWFEDLYQGSRFNGWGAYTAGPAPTGLPVFSYELLDDGRRLRVTGPAGEAQARDEPRGGQQSPRGPSCLDDFSGAVVHTPPDEVPVLDPGQLPRDRWVWARLVVGGTDADPVVCDRDGNCRPQAPAAPDLVPYEPDQSDRTPTEGLWLARRTQDNTVLLRKPAQPDLHDPTPLVADGPPEDSNRQTPPGQERAFAEVDTPYGRAAVELTVEPDRIEPDGQVSVALNNVGDVELDSGTSYEVQRWDGNAWTARPNAQDFDLSLEPLEPGDSQWLAPWPPDIDGEASPEPGWYRIVKTGLLLRVSDDDASTVEEDLDLEVDVRFEVRE